MTTSETKPDIVHAMAVAAIAFAVRETGEDMSLKSITCDYLMPASGDIDATVELVRKTRSLLFVNIAVSVDGAIVATGSAILSKSDQV